MNISQDQKAVLAIDPGTTESAILYWENGRVEWCDIKPNEEIRRKLYEVAHEHDDTEEILAIEMIASYGMPVGRETFETCLWIGRFIEAFASCGRDTRLCYRQQIKLHLCQSPRAKDANVSQALKDKLGQVGTKKNPGPLYGVKSHIWSALAVAIYALETTEITKETV